MLHLFHSGNIVEECPLLSASLSAAETTAETARHHGVATMRRVGWAVAASLVLHMLLFGVLQMVGGEQTTGVPAATVLSVSLAQLPEARGAVGKTPVAATRSALSSRPAINSSSVALSVAPSQPILEAAASPPSGSATASGTMANAGGFAGAGEGGGHGASGEGGTIQLATPLYRLNPPPVYPTLARLRRYEGVVLLRVMVLADGTVGALQLEKTSGYASLDEAALKAVRGWVFAPGRRSGAPLAMEVQVPVRFHLRNGN